MGSSDFIGDIGFIAEIGFTGGTRRIARRQYSASAQHQNLFGSRRLGLNLSKDRLRGGGKHLVEGGVK